MFNILIGLVAKGPRNPAHMTYYKSSNLKVARSKKEKGKISISLIIILGVVILSVFYLIQANNIVAGNFELRSIQQILKEKQDNNQELLISLTQTRSLSNLEAAAKDLNLVSIEKVNYLKTVSGYFAFSQ